MTKKAKILLLLTVLGLLVLSYLLLTAKPLATKPAEIKLSTDIVKFDQEKIEKNYKTNAKNIIGDFQEKKTAGSLTVEAIKEAKNNLLSLKVPAKFKELHIQLVLALDKMENYLNTEEEESRLASQKIIEEAKANYSWLY